MSYKEIYIKPHTTEWHNFRKNGYGASEISGVLASFNDDLANDTWNDCMKIHMEKIGEPVVTFNGNKSSEAGHFMEPLIVNMFNHYDLQRNDSEHMYRNLNGRFGKPVKYNRTISRKVYVTNKKYPWLFASPDSIGYSGKNKYSVECKNTTSMEANKYTNKVSPSFICQVMQVLLITGWSHSHICIHIDGRDLVVFTVYPDKDFFEWIIECSRESWLNVEKARAIKKEFNIDKYYGVHEDFIDPSLHEAIGELQSLEPSYNGSKAQHNFIKEHIVPTPEVTERDITQDEWNLVGDLVALDARKSKYDSDIQEIRDKLMVSLGGYHKAIYHDGKNAYISCTKDKNGTKRFFISQGLKKEFS